MIFDDFFWGYKLNEPEKYMKALGAYHRVQNKKMSNIEQGIMNVEF